jgi:hypothetical protein
MLLIHERRTGASDASGYVIHKTVRARGVSIAPMRIISHYEHLGAVRAAMLWRWCIDEIALERGSALSGLHWLV